MHFPVFAKNFRRPWMKLTNFFCQFPNPLAPRVSRMGGYTSKCEKKSKSLHPNSEAEPIKGRRPSVDYTPFYRQHLCGGQCTQEQSRPQQHMWNSKLFFIFLLNLLLHKVYISNILCGLRL